jgi:hypothetical protein
VADVLGYWGVRLLSVAVYVVAVVAAISVTPENLQQALPNAIYMGVAVTLLKAFFGFCVPVLGLWLVELGSPFRKEKRKKETEMTAILKRRAAAGAEKKKAEGHENKNLSYLDENKRPYLTFASAGTKTALVLSITLRAAGGVNFGAATFLGSLLTPVFGWLVLFMTKTAMRPVLYPSPTEARAAAANGGVWTFRPALYESM